ncbi:hypothetical protein A2U01_0029690, partial [Trifolium medium]|nr:hypothetical protein [Trifolium medium]
KTDLPSSNHCGEGKRFLSDWHGIGIKLPDQIVMQILGRIKQLIPPFSCNYSLHGLVLTLWVNDDLFFRPNRPFCRYLESSLLFRSKNFGAIIISWCARSAGTCLLFFGALRLLGTCRFLGSHAYNHKNRTKQNRLQTSQAVVMDQEHMNIASLSPETVQK